MADERAPLKRLVRLAAYNVVQNDERQAAERERAQRRRGG